MRQSSAVLLVIGILLVGVGVVGLVIASNKLAIYNDCSVNPNYSHSCNIYSNSGAMNDYNSNMTVEAASGIAAMLGFILSLGAFLHRPNQNQGV